MLVQPMQDDAAEFAPLAEIERQALLAARRRIAAPGGRRLAVDRERGLRAACDRRSARLGVGQIAGTGGSSRSASRLT